MTSFVAFFISLGDGLGLSEQLAFLFVLGFISGEVCKFASLDGFFEFELTIGELLLLGLNEKLKLFDLTQQ